MKIKKICAAISALSLLTVMAVGQSISADEVATEAVIGSDSTELSTEESTTATEETTDAVKSILVGELNVFDEWTDGDFSKTVALGTFGYDFGAFSSLMLNDTVIDSSNYTVSQNGNESITFTISKAFMSILSTNTNYFTVDFENVTIQPAFAVDISETVENVTEAPTTAVTTVTTYNKNESPKTGANGVGLFFGLLTVSGLTVFFAKKKI